MRHAQLALAHLPFALSKEEVALHEALANVYSEFTESLESSFGKSGLERLGEGSSAGLVQFTPHLHVHSYLSVEQSATRTVTGKGTEQKKKSGMWSPHQWPYWVGFRTRVKPSFELIDPGAAPIINAYNMQVASSRKLADFSGRGVRVNLDKEKFTIHSPWRGSASGSAAVAFEGASDKESWQWDHQYSISWRLRPMTREKTGRIGQ